MKIAVPPGVLIKEYVMYVCMVGSFQGDNIKYFWRFYIILYILTMKLNLTSTKEVYYVYWNWFGKMALCRP